MTGMVLQFGSSPSSFLAPAVATQFISNTITSEYNTLANSTDV